MSREAAQLYQQTIWQSWITRLSSNPEFQAELSRQGLVLTVPKVEGNCFGLSNMHLSYCAKGQEEKFFQLVMVVSGLTPEQFRAPGFSIASHCKKHGVDFSEWVHFIEEVTKIQEKQAVRLWNSNHGLDSPASFHETQIVTFGNDAQIASDLEKMLTKNPQKFYVIAGLGHAVSLRVIDNVREGARYVVYDSNGFYQEYSSGELKQLVHDFRAHLGYGNPGFEFPITFHGINFQATDFSKTFLDKILPKMKMFAAAQPQIDAILKQYQSGLSMTDTLLLLQRELAPLSHSRFYGDFAKECDQILKGYFTNRECFEGILQRDARFLTHDKYLDSQFGSTNSFMHCVSYCGGSFIRAELLERVRGFYSEDTINFIGWSDILIRELFDQRRVVQDQRISQLQPDFFLNPAFQAAFLKRLDSFFQEVRPSVEYFLVFQERIKGLAAGRFPEGLKFEIHKKMFIEIACQADPHALISLSRKIKQTEGVGYLIALMREAPGSFQKEHSLRSFVYKTLFKSIAAGGNDEALKQIAKDLKENGGGAILKSALDALPGELGEYARRVVGPFVVARSAPEWIQRGLAQAQVSLGERRSSCAAEVAPAQEAPAPIGLSMRS